MINQFRLAASVLLILGNVAICQGQKALPNDTILYKIAPNGMKIHMIFLSKTPCIDYSCYEFLVEYKSYEYSEKKVVGKVGLTLGELRFDGTSEKLRYNGVSGEALQLLSDWIVKNKED